MSRDKEWLKLFEQKGYCIVEIPSKWDKKGTVYKMWIEDFEEAMSRYNCESKRFVEDENKYKSECDSEYKIYYQLDKVKIHLIKDLTSYIDTILAINEENKGHIYYRGHASSKYLLQPAIYREGNENILNNEDIIYRDIISSKPHFFSDCPTVLEKLVKMQHHGIPTRLLDLTENPLIALFFACKVSGYDKNHHAEVNVFKVAESKFKYYDSDTVSVLANMVKCPVDFDITDIFEKDIEEFNEKKSISELIHFIREDKAYFLPKINHEHLDDFSLVVKPKMSIDRIINQSGAFVLFGIKKVKKICSDFNINEEDYKQNVIIIPQFYKQKIINQLRLLNINESTVFCDIDSTANFFKNKYTS